MARLYRRHWVFPSVARGTRSKSVEIYRQVHQTVTFLAHRWQMSEVARTCIIQTTKQNCGCCVGKPGHKPLQTTLVRRDRGHVVRICLAIPKILLGRTPIYCDGIMFRTRSNCTIKAGGVSRIQVIR